MSELEVRGLVKRFGGNAVVDGVSFGVEDGEFFVLLGPSGGGKSTMLRLICGLEQPDGGQIWIHGRDVTRLPPRARNLGMVFQDYGLYPNMDVSGNIAYGLEARRVPRAEIERRVAQAAEMLGLAPLLRRSINDLSGGEQQRVALARALVKDADAYLYDEPLSNLDPKLRHQARRDILAVHRTKRKPSVYVTHDQTEAFAMGDRIAVIAGGRLQQVGPPDDLVHAPANLFVARFIGTPPMNLVRGDLTRRDGAYWVQADGIDVLVPARWAPTLERYRRQDVIVGIRPDAIVTAEAARDLEGQAGPMLTGTLADVEPLVGETVATLQLGHGTTLTAVFPDTGESAVLAPGEVVQVGIDVQKLCLFDPTTEQALTAA